MNNKFKKPDIIFFCHGNGKKKELGHSSYGIIILNQKTNEYTEISGIKEVDHYDSRQNMDAIMLCFQIHMERFFSYGLKSLIYTKAAECVAAINGDSKLENNRYREFVNLFNNESSIRIRGIGRSPSIVLGPVVKDLATSVIVRSCEEIYQDFPKHVVDKYSPVNNESLPRKEQWRTLQSYFNFFDIINKENV